ncbi:uncharacterized protein LOC144337996 isoform X1 [Macaca mulatta]
MRIWSRLFLARGAEGGVGSCCAPSGSGAAWTRELATVTGTVASSNGNLVAKRECDAVTVTCPGSVSAVSGTLFSSRRPRHSDHRTTPTRPPRVRAICRWARRSWEVVSTLFPEADKQSSKTHCSGRGPGCATQAPCPSRQAPGWFPAS